MFYSRILTLPSKSVLLINFFSHTLYYTRRPTVNIKHDSYNIALLMT